MCIRDREKEKEKEEGEKEVNSAISYARATLCPVLTWRMVLPGGVGGGIRRQHSMVVRVCCPDSSAASTRFSRLSFMEERVTFKAALLTFMAAGIAAGDEGGGGGSQEREGCGHDVRRSRPVDRSGP
eukprot:273539-Rhodomonas_salina.4